MSGFVFACRAAAAIALVLITGCAATDPAAPRRAEVIVPMSSELVSKANSEPPIEESGRELRVMTFNVRVKTFLDALGNSWDSRKDLLVQTIREFGPDVLGTQECLASQSDDLRGALSDYGFVGVGRDDGNRAGEMCGVFYKNDRFEKIDSGHFWLSSTPDRVGSKSWGSAFVRMVTWVKLKPREGSEPAFCVFNTHFDVFGKHARIESAKLLRQRMQLIAPDMPCIITGDFNDTPGSTAYETLLSSTGGPSLIDAFRMTHPIANNGVEGTQHSFHGNDDGQRIDWIITNGAFEPVESQIVHTHKGSKFPSDHFPVAAVLKPVAIAQPVARIE